MWRKKLPIRSESIESPPPLAINFCRNEREREREKSDEVFIDGALDSAIKEGVRDLRRRPNNKVYSTLVVGVSFYVLALNIAVLIRFWILFLW